MIDASSLRIRQMQESDPARLAEAFADMNKTINSTNGTGRKTSEASE